VNIVVGSGGESPSPQPCPARDARAWRIREARLEDVDALCRLFAVCVGYTRERDHVEWKFFKNPFGRPLLIVAESDDGVVGLYALWPLQLRSESSHEEGGLRDWAVGTTHFTGDELGNVKYLHAVRVGPPPKFEPQPGSEFILEADLVLLALGFLGPVKPGMIEQLGLALDARSNIATDNYMSSVPGVFAAGDMRRGQSLIVWAIAEGRKAARAVDMHLMGASRLQ